MNRRLRLMPPKRTLAQRSGSAMKPIGLPVGSKILTPSCFPLPMPQQAADAWAAFHVSFRLDDLTRARRLLEQSLAVDAGYARSHALMGRTYQAAFVSQR